MSIQKPFVTIPNWNQAIMDNPPAIFRGAPFWSWNGTLDRDRLTKQLGVYKNMGMGGGHIHVRTGLTDEYLGDAFMGHVKALTEEARRQGLLTWLYDEDRWPSGFAGGLVTKDPANRCRHLLITSVRPQPGEVRYHPIHHGPPQPVTERTFVAAWALRFEETTLASWRRIDETDDANGGEVAYYAYIEVAPDFSWFNNQQYANLLDPKAIKQFIDVTYERYFEVVGDEFGKSIPSIFTDEPLFRDMGRVSSWDDRSDIRIAWVNDFPQTYSDEFGVDVLDSFPAVLFDAADGTSPKARWRFRDHHTQRFVDAFAKQIGAWCDEHSISLTGHMMEEPTLRQQSGWIGEAMRSLNYFQLPGIDMLCDLTELTTAKQAQSVARQNGRPGTLSELYGVTGWDFTFDGHLRQGNWQAALGVVVRVHHLSWYSMAGEAKRDYPASIGWHVPWWAEYPVVEDHFARVSAAMQTGKPVCRVGLLQPIESYWITQGPVDAHQDEEALIENSYLSTFNSLLSAQIDTDLVSEALLTVHGKQDESARLCVGEMRYEVLVIPPTLTLRSSTLDRLAKFVEHGGTVVLLGDAPELVDAEQSTRVAEAAKAWVRCPTESDALLHLLAPWRDVELTRGGARVSGPLYQLREEADGARILFMVSSPTMRDTLGTTLRIRGHLNVASVDTRTGKSEATGEVWTDDGWTHVPVDLYEADHILFRLTTGSEPTQLPVKATWVETGRLGDPVDITLSEPNVLLLDRAAWSLDDCDWQPVEEVLRVDNRVRAALGLPDRHGNIAQPWADPQPEPRHRVALKYEIKSDIAVSGARLAIERAATASVMLDGKPISAVADGYYVDEDIATIPLPDIAPGDHALVVEWPFRPEYGLEASYIVGDFGVSVAGMHARIVAAPTQLALGNFE